MLKRIFMSEDKIKKHSTKKIFIQLFLMQGSNSWRWASVLILHRSFWLQWNRLGSGKDHDWSLGKLCHLWVNLNKNANTKLGTWTRRPVLIWKDLEMFYLNTIEQLFLFVEQVDQLEDCLPYSRLLPGILILVVFQNLRWNSNKTSLCLLKI